MKVLVIYLKECFQCLNYKRRQWMLDKMKSIVLKQSKTLQTAYKKAKE